MSECQEQTAGKNTLLVFNEGLQKLLKTTLESRKYDEEALHMAKIAKVVRHEIFVRELFPFTGKFDHDCQENSVPPSLKSLVAMLLYGPTITDQEAQNSQACLTISQ